jgi:septum site-determining protein MinD
MAKERRIIMGKTIVITSGKGGVGKTTTTANIGAALAMLNKKVVLIDADIGLRNLDMILGLENRIVYDIVEVAEGKAELKKALIKDKKFNDNLCLLPASQTRDKSALSPQQMIDICQELEKDFDYVLIDCPAGIEQGFINAVSAAEQAIIVTNPELSSVRDADRVVGLLESKGFDKPWLIVNRVRPSMVKKGDMLDIVDVVEVLSIDLLGFVPEEDKIISSTNRGVPVVLDHTARAATAYKNIAQRINGVKVPLMPFEDESLFKKMFKKIGIFN